MPSVWEQAAGAALYRLLLSDAGSQSEYQGMQKTRAMSDASDECERLTRVSSWTGVLNLALEISPPMSQRAPVCLNCIECFDVVNVLSIEGEGQ